MPSDAMAEEQTDKKELSTSETPQNARRPRRVRALRLNERDRHLLALLVRTRWLTTDQVSRLMFPGRADGIQRRRLRALSREESSATLVQHPWVTLDGVKQVWGLTELGASQAAYLLGEEPMWRPEPFQPETTAHHVQLTELYVRLRELQMLPLLQKARAPGAGPRALQHVYARADRQQVWRWKVTVDTELPWQAYKPGHGPMQRVLRPDALLELVTTRRRLFLEYETGSHSLRSRSPEKKGTTEAKLARYQQYCVDVADVATRQSHYQQHFKDGFSPELWVLVPRVTRANSVNALIGEWRRQLPGARLNARALTVDQAIAELAPTLGLNFPGRAPNSPTQEPNDDSRSTEKPGVHLSRSEATRMSDFFADVRADLKARQVAASEDRVAAPIVPRHYEAVKRTVARLRDSA